MHSSAFEDFIDQAIACGLEQIVPADCVIALPPRMLDLIDEAGSFLQPQHDRDSPAGDTRNLIYEAPDASLSLYAIARLPGRWTPAHDHGSWGVVGVVEGVLQHGSDVRRSPDRGAEADIDLARDATVRLRRGAVTSLVPNPVHIHGTGAPAKRPRAVSLRLDGRTMGNFNVYLATRSRWRTCIAHNESSATSEMPTTQFVGSP